MQTSKPVRYSYSEQFDGEIGSSGYPAALVRMHIDLQNNGAVAVVTEVGVVHRIVGDFVHLVEVVGNFDTNVAVR